LFSSPACRAHLALQSFPTRRSSDLCAANRPTKNSTSPSSASAAKAWQTLKGFPAKTSPRFATLTNVRWTKPLRNFRTRKSTATRSEEHTSELQSRFDLVCRLLLEKK